MWVSDGDSTNKMPEAIGEDASSILVGSGAESLRA